MSPPPSKVPYSKPWMSHADQVSRLAGRGLVVADEATAIEFLSHLNYYRFSGYCLAFEATRHQFQSGTTFEQVTRAYDFDLELRDLVTEALETVEVDLRATVAYEFGQEYGAFGHTDAANFHHHFPHRGWLERLREEAERSSELFVSHFKSTYEEFPDLPVWTVTETMSFGSLSKMIGGMHKTCLKRVARRYRLQPQTLRKTTHHFVYIRNLCAHHSRLWDRVWAIKPMLPAGKNWAPPLLPGNNRLYSTLLLLRHFMAHISAVQPFASQWQQRLLTHLAKPPSAAAPLVKMGMPVNWTEHSAWGE